MISKGLPWGPEKERRAARFSLRMRWLGEAVSRSVQARGVAVGVEEDGFGGEELTVAVDFDGAAFEDHAAKETAEAEGLGDGGGDGVVEVPGWEFSAPGVEFPVGDGDFTGLVMFDEDGAVISAPDVVVGMVEELDVFGDGFGAVAEGGDGWVVGTGGVDADGFEA
jgi:hypothetical protein